MNIRRLLYVFALVLLGSVWLPLTSAQADAVGGPLAKQGSLTGAWSTEWTDGTAIYVASDPTNGPLIVVQDATGNLWAKEGSVTVATWTEIWTSGTPTAVSVASDPTNGPLIAVLSGGTAYAKEGSLTAPWTTEFTGVSGASGLSVASDATNGPLIAVLSNGTVVRQARQPDGAVAHRIRQPRCQRGVRGE
ncbi:MAG: hypothetical protein ABSA08_07995 [Acidimicrobiales bacterium]|jgi:hypothetical protein